MTKKDEQCDVRGCKDKMFATLFPNDLDFKVCARHFKERVGQKILRVAGKAEIIDKTGEHEL